MICLDCQIFTDLISLISVESAVTLTGRFLDSKTLNSKRDFSRMSAPFQRRGRKADIGVRARTFAPIGKIGP